MEPTIVREVVYPDSDGEPMGETQLHIGWSIRLLQILEHRYERQRVLTGANLIFYWVEGEPQYSVVPDLFVVLDCDPDPPRRVFKTWEEGCVPNFVLEVTSSSTRRKDESTKPGIFMDIGVGEYVMYDPTGDYLDPPLRMLRLVDGRYVAVEPDAEGRLLSEELGIVLRLVDGALELRDAETDEVLRPAVEVEREWRLAERAAREALEAAHAEERAAHGAERQAREAAEAELERLRERLAELEDSEE